MASDDSYTILIIPLHNSLCSPDALNCFHWMGITFKAQKHSKNILIYVHVTTMEARFRQLKRRKDLERQKDILWAGLQVVDQTQLWYQNRLQLNLQRLYSINTGDMIEEDRRSCALRSCMQRVNGSLGSLLTDSCIWNNLAPEESSASDWDLRWSNATLVKEVNQRHQQISMLELEKERLLQQLVSYSTSDCSHTTHFQF